VPKKPSASPKTRNKLLDSLSEADLAALLAHAELVSMKVEEVAFWPGKPFRHVYFPIDCSIGTIQKMDDGSEAELSSIGWEGFASPRPLLGLDRLSACALCTIAGQAYRVPIARFLQLAPHASALFRRALRYNGALMVVYAQFSACNRFHQPLERCAKWLLLAHDRARRDSIEVTHKFLARILGIQRPAASLVMGLLEKRGAIAGGRGRITIRNRAKL
jgi:CRP-like cAMP-binding protein